MNKHWSGVMAAAVSLAACGMPAESDSVGTARQEIRNGTIDTTSTNVGAYFVENNFIPGIGPYIWCAATLVAPRVMLTAGHCVRFTEANNIGFSGQHVVFATNILDAPTSDWLTVSAAYVMPGYDETSSNKPNPHDIGIVILAEPAPAGIPLTPLAPANFLGTHLLNETVVDGVGYGSDDSGVRDGYRRTAEMRAYSLAKINYALQPIDGTATCFGDSGGPTFWKDPTLPRYQVGLHSSGTSSGACGSKNYDVRIDYPEAVAFINGMISANP